MIYYSYYIDEHPLYYATLIISGRGNCLCIMRRQKTYLYFLTNNGITLIKNDTIRYYTN